MTVKELCNRESDIERAISQLNSALDAFRDTLNSVPTDDKLSKEVRSSLTRSNYAVCTAAHEAIKLLREYSGLMDGIMRNTRLAWPPVCTTQLD